MFLNDLINFFVKGGFMNIFLGIPEFIWNLIFTLLTTLICGVIVATFTSTFLKKKEERTRVAGVILEKRIESEREILSFLENSLTKEEIPCDDPNIKSSVSPIIEGYPQIVSIQYSSVFLSYDNFLEFYNEFNRLYAENRLWMDENVRDHLLLMQGYFSWINVIPVVVRKVTLPRKKKITDKEFQLACDKSFLLYGIILDNEINALIADLDTKVVNSIYKLNLNSPRRSLTRNGMYNRSTIKIIHTLRDRTILGMEWARLIGLVVSATLIACNIDTSELTEEQIDDILLRIPEINHYE